MNKLTKTAVMGALAAIVAATPAKAQVSAAYTTHHSSVVRLERATDNSYAFVDLTGEKLDLEKLYGEARFNVPLKAGLKAGVDLNYGTEFNDRAALQLDYDQVKVQDKKLVYLGQARIAKSLTDGSPVRFGYAGILELGNAGVKVPVLRNIVLSTWGSVDLYGKGKRDAPALERGTQFLGEIEADYSLGKNMQAVVRGEHYPWSGYAAHLGVKTKL